LINIHSLNLAMYKFVYQWKVVFYVLGMPIYLLLHWTLAPWWPGIATNWTVI
jgi:hypothetical protein